MPFQWLQMRISEENDRRRRERATLDRLPSALDEVRQELQSCVETYCKAFGEELATLGGTAQKIRVTTPAGKVEVALDSTIPGLQVNREGAPLIIEIGLLPGDKLFFRDREKDQYVSMEELTRRILDRIFFPKLSE